MEGLFVSGYELTNASRLSFQTPDDGYSYFFGYYDKSPLSPDGRFLLAHRTTFDGRDNRPLELCEIGYFDLRTDAFTVLATTSAWNWQIGSQLQWLPTSEKLVAVYNVATETDYVAVLHTLDDTQRRLCAAVYALDPQGEWGYGVHYKRHYWCRPGYDYKTFEDPQWRGMICPQDAIYRVHLKYNEQEEVVALAQLLTFQPLAEHASSPHWLEHITISPDGQRMLFFHRWRADGKDQSRVFVSNVDGANLVMLPDARFFSHYCWRDNTTVTLWTRADLPAAVDDTNSMSASPRTVLYGLTLGLFKKSVTVLKRRLPERWLHWLKRGIPAAIRRRAHPPTCLTDFDVSGRVLRRIMPGQVRGNGHQSWFRDGRYLLNDTYQDEAGYRHLMVIDTEQEQVTALGRFFSSYNDCTFRCDLHPRLSVDETHVVIDSAHNQQRKMMILELASVNA